MHSVKEKKRKKAFTKTSNSPIFDDNSWKKNCSRLEYQWGYALSFLFNAWVSPEPYLKFVSLSCRQIYTNGKDDAPLNTRILTILLPGLRTVHISRDKSKSKNCAFDTFLKKYLTIYISANPLLAQGTIYLIFKIFKKC